MARPRKYVIKLTDDEFRELKSIIRKKATSKTIRCRCQIILDLDEAHGKVLTHEQSAKSNGVCLATVTSSRLGDVKNEVAVQGKILQNIVVFFYESPVLYVFRFWVATSYFFVSCFIS